MTTPDTSKAMTAERDREILIAEGLPDWRVVRTNLVEAYCWPDLSKIELPQDGDLALLLHEIAHAKAGAATAGHSADWANIFTDLVRKHFDAQAEEIAALKAELATTWESALEEAARAIESEESEPQWGEDRNTRVARESYSECTKIVRALKDQTPSESDADRRTRIIRERAAEIARDYEP
jgi:hypothetical protein